MKSRMKYLNKFDELLLEKRISQIAAKIEVVFNYDIITTKHAEKRQNQSDRGIDMSNNTYISNMELSEFVLYFRKEISQFIVSGKIMESEPFIIRSFDRELAIVLDATRKEDNNWRLVIITTMRVSEEEPFRHGKDQLVIDK